MGSIAREDEGCAIWAEAIVEVREASPTHYKLRIESFSLLSESGIEKFESNEFEACGHKWKLIIYPDGNGRENGSEHISVYLAISGTSSLPAGWEVTAIFTFFLYNQLCDNYLTVRGKMRRFQSIKLEWGLLKFLPHYIDIDKAFKEASNGHLIDDKCVFGAEIFVAQRQAIGECLSVEKSNDKFKREWKICNFSNLGIIWLSEEFTAGDHKWNLWLFPKGNEKNRGCNISIFLVYVDSKDFDHHRKVKANYSFCIKDQIGGECDKRLSSKIIPPTFILMVLVFICYLVNFLRLSLILSFFFAYCDWFSATSQTWGYPSFMPLTELHDQKKGYIVNDCIVVEVEVEVVFKHRVKSLS
uniref:Uncharacterized protein LOC104216367 n=1 Tax=Nicotiana sylvestris TaxID=4096 RepID=A0A1U7VIF2_NICSY|nr:PREDICTED: uncharacterized protein LOC104216367 [Nicotiana sylvestris]